MPRTHLRTTPAVTGMSVGASALPRVVLDRRALPRGSSRRVITILDARVPSGRAQLLAWNVVPQGQHDLSTFLCRSATGAYFALCRSGSRAELPADIVPLSPRQAATWFDAHPTHFADRNALQ